MLYVFIGLALFVVVVLAANIKIVPQSKAYVIERLGAYNTTWQTGLHVKIPLLDKVSKIVSLKTHTTDLK